MKKIAAIIWLISICFASPSLYLLRMTEHDHSCGIPIDPKMNTIFMGFNAVVVFSIPAIILLFLYAKIIYTLSKSIVTAQRMRPASSTNSGMKTTTTDDIRGRKQVMVALVFMLALFMFCWGPHLIYSFVTDLTPYRDQDRWLIVHY
ncbi:hypothetical protein CAPTEDRAFT_208286 [Capitella teleta]|uniref:G-protein coupled receptors family 1 profile domain-containing protein n=1 Tax=Capitella teleta TaxID=283909 RepID=R7VI03_CAPTE|nr:hypothetical protein CAPTEDRAFT_208286 [Capitella teleta]|eukprot:ELU18229.1 hypothetical protein CAPTEDRAFT_208286 [Capitella teleta]